MQLQFNKLKALLKISIHLLNSYRHVGNNAPTPAVCVHVYGSYNTCMWLCPQFSSSETRFFLDDKLP